MNITCMSVARKASILTCIIPLFAIGQENHAPAFLEHSIAKSTGNSGLSIELCCPAMGASIIEKPERKSAFLGVVYSLLFPGMGELYAGRFDRGKYPLIAEAALWLGFIGFNAYGGWIQDDARNFARQYAGISTGSKDDQFFVDIANYNSVYEFNSIKLVERNLPAIYPEDPTSGYNWQWTSVDDRLKYKDMRIQSDEMFNAAKFVVLGMIANRIWSAVETALFIRDYNASLTAAQNRPTFRPQILTYAGHIDGVRLVFFATF